MISLSISSRLTIWFSAILLVGLILFGAAMWFDLDRTLRADRSQTLIRRAHRLDQLLRDAEISGVGQRSRKFQEFADATGGGLIEVFKADGALAYPSPSLAATRFPWPAVKIRDHEEFSEVNFAGQPYRVLTLPLASGSQSFVLCLAAPLAGNLQLLHTFSAGLLWTIPVLLTLSALGGYLLSRKALKPVDRITAAVCSMSVSNLSQRLPVPRTGDELQRLAYTCNAMLARLESAVDQIKQFTADASHELRNPLSFIRTIAEVALRNQPVDYESRRAFEQIVEECAKAGHLLGDMLTLARADAGNTNLVFEPIDLVEVVTDVCEKARLSAKARHHMLAVSLGDTDSVPVLGDYSSVRRLLWIILENATKYTPVAGTINVSLRATAQNATVTVEDNGIGISESALPHIFQRFYRADPSRGKVDGFGLGLAIAKWIADEHKAEISVESKEGAGSVFKVVFPVSADCPDPIFSSSASS